MWIVLTGGWYTLLICPTLDCSLALSLLAVQS